MNHYIVLKQNYQSEVQSVSLVPSELLRSQLQVSASTHSVYLSSLFQVVFLQFLSAFAIDRNVLKISVPNLQHLVNEMENLNL